MISLGATWPDGPVDGFVTRPTEHDASTGNGMSMADDTYSRSYRSPDPYRRPAERRRAGWRQRPAGRARAPDRAERSLRRAGRSPARGATGAARVALNRAARLATRSGPRAALCRDASRPRATHIRRPTSMAIRLAPPEAYAEDHRQYGQHFDDVHAEPRTTNSRPGRITDRARLRAAPGHAAAPADHDAEHYYEDGGPLEPHEEETYDDAPRARRQAVSPPRWR